MDPVTIMAIMSAAKMVQDRGKEERDRQLAAETQRYSPWTGLRAQPVEEVDYVGGAANAYGGAIAQKQKQEMHDAAIKNGRVSAVSLQEAGNSPIDPYATKSALKNLPYQMDYNTWRGMK